MTILILKDMVAMIDFRNFIRQKTFHNHYLQLYHHTLSLPPHPALRLQAQTLEPQSHLQQLFSRFSVVLIGHTGVQGVQRLYLSCPIFVSDFSDKYRSCGEIEA